MGQERRVTEPGVTPLPRIVRSSLLEGARLAEGVAVVIDVYRAFTSAAFMAHLGATQIMLEAEASAVLQLKAETGCLAAGEVGGRRVPGFDIGNSPSRILAAGPETFRGRAVAQRTSAGSIGAVVAGNRTDLVVLGSYVTASAICSFILGPSPQPEVVTLIAMGSAGKQGSPEDEACADYIEHLLVGRRYDHADALGRILAHDCTLKFLRGDQAHLPPSDPILCLQRDLFDFALVASRERGKLVARPVPQPGSHRP